MSDNPESVHAAIEELSRRYDVAVDFAFNEGVKEGLKRARLPDDLVERARTVVEWWDETNADEDDDEDRGAGVGVLRDILTWNEER